MGYRRTSVSHAREAYYIVCIAIFIVSVAFALSGPGGYFEMRKVSAEMETHRARVAVLKRSNEERLKTIDALKHDKSALEKHARKQGYAREDEIIQQLPDEPAVPSQPAQSPK